MIDAESLFNRVDKKAVMVEKKVLFLTIKSKRMDQMQLYQSFLI